MGRGAHVAVAFVCVMAVTVAATLRLRGDTTGVGMQTNLMEIIQCEACGDTNNCKRTIVVADGQACYPCIHGYHCQYLLPGDEYVYITWHVNNNQCKGYRPQQRTDLNKCFPDTGVEYIKYGQAAVAR
jgi:hypothetical protein